MSTNANLNDYLIKIQGLAFKTNQTLGFFVMEKRFSKYFIEQWRIFSKNKNLISTHDSLVLISNVDETIYWLDNENISW